MNDDYGSLLNRTYLIDLFIIGAVLGSIALFVAPKLSLVLSEKRGGKSIRFQGLLISFALLILSSVILQFWPR